MRRSLACTFTAFLVLAGLPVASAAAPSYTPARAPDPRVGDPLWHADPDVWLPVLAEGGSLAQAAEAAKASLQVSYNLYRLGDANGDGRDDFLLESRSASAGEEDPEAPAVVRAVSGVDFMAIWNLEVPADSYWYVFGDVDGDEVQDLLVERGEATGDVKSQSAGPVGASRVESVTRITMSLIAGTTGKVMFPLTCESVFQYTTARANAPVGSARFSDTRYTGCYAVAIPGSSGVDLVTRTFSDYRGPSVFTLAVSANVRVSAFDLRVARHTSAGERSWEWTLKRDNMYGSLLREADFTGDGTADLAFILYPESFGYVYANEGAELPNPQGGQVGVVDGKTGRSAWSAATAQSLFVEAMQAPGLRGPGSMDLVISEFVQAEGTPGSWQAVLRQLNGATGVPMSTRVMKDKIAVAMGHGYVDGDGRGELLLLQAAVKGSPVGEPEIEEFADLSMVRADWSPVWGPLRLGPDDGWPGGLSEIDLDADGAADLEIERSVNGSEERAVQFVSGASGRTIWQYTKTPGVVSLEVIGDVDSTPGDDVAITIFDIPQDGMAGGPSAGPGASPPSRKGPTNQPNFADHVGRLELRRGTDRELIWEKKVHDPSEVQNVSAPFVSAQTERIADTNGDGVADLLFNLHTPTFIIMGISAEGVTMERSDPGLLFALLINGSDGATLKGFPEAKGRAAAVIGKAANIPAPDTGTAAGGVVPSLGPLWLAAILGLLAVAVRRQA